MYSYATYKAKTHRVIPSRFPTVSPFDWAESAEEIEQLALLESLTNDRLKTQLSHIHLVPKSDWVIAEGAAPLMSPFTHPGYSRFSDGSFGIYYASDSLKTAVCETKFHRERFLGASKEAPCQIQMREYITHLRKQLVDIRSDQYQKYLSPDTNTYSYCQQFGQEIKQNKEWGIMYPSVRREESLCFAIFRPPALTLPIQGCHLEYIWDGTNIVETNILKAI